MRKQATTIKLMHSLQWKLHLSSGLNLIYAFVDAPLWYGNSNEERNAYRKQKYKLNKCFPRIKLTQLLKLIFGY